MAYTLFDGIQFDDLAAIHIGSLADKPEGWFVEYKREPCASKDYAKEAGAFANSQGGWIFVGLGEDPQTRLPTAGPGVVKSDAARLRDAARDAIMQNLSPAPTIELKVVDGPMPSLGIAEDRSILVIRVAQGVETPHVHSSGRIYIRRADAAHVVEDRAELDALHARRAQARDVADEELELGFDTHWVDAISAPWVHVALIPHPANTSKQRALVFDQFKQAVNASDGRTLHLPDVYPSALGYVARNHSHQEIPHGAATTLEYASSGAFYITMPLSVGETSGPELASFMEGGLGLRFVELLHRRRFERVGVIDGTSLATCMVGFGEYIERILAQTGAAGTYIGRIRVYNVFRRVPFFESEAYVSWCEKNAIPVVLRNEFRIPWPRKQWFPVEDIQASDVSITILMELLYAFGIEDRIITSLVPETLRALSARSAGQVDS